MRCGYHWRCERRRDSRVMAVPSARSVPAAASAPMMWVPVRGIALGEESPGAGVVDSFGSGAGVGVLLPPGSGVGVSSASGVGVLLSLGSGFGVSFGVELSLGVGEGSGVGVASGSGVSGGVSVTLNPVQATAGI